MKIHSIMERLESLYEMTHAELKAIQKNLSNFANNTFGMDFRFSNHSVRDRFVHGDRSDVTGIDSYKTVLWGFKHPQFISIVNDIKNDDDQEAEQTVRFMNVFNQLNIILVVRKNMIEVITGDYRSNWENSRSYRKDVVIKVPKDAWTDNEFQEERRKQAIKRKQKH